MVSENQTTPVGRKPLKRAKLPKRPLYNPSQENYQPLRIFEYALSDEDFIAWQQRNGPKLSPPNPRVDIDPILDALREIDMRLQGKESLRIMFVDIWDHANKDFAYCFPIGSNRNQPHLDNARNWARVRKFQREMFCPGGTSRKNHDVMNT